METKKKIVFLICLAIFIGLTIFIVCNISENYTCSDSCKIIKYVSGQTNQSNTLTNVSYAPSESCVPKINSKYHQSNVVPFSTNGFEIKLNNDKGELRSGRVKSVSQYKGDMMFIIDIDDMVNSDIAFYAIWLWNETAGEIDLMETANKDSSVFATTLIRYEDSKNPVRITTQCPKNNWALVPFKNTKYGPHKLVFIQKGSVVTVFMDPDRIDYPEDNGIPKIFYKNSDSMKQYDLKEKYYANALYTGKDVDKQSFSDLENKPWHLIFNLEARHFDKNSNVVSCNNSVFTNPERASFKIKEVKYYDLTGKPNPASPSSGPGPAPNCCTSKGEDACNDNGCSSFIKCKDTSEDVFKNNCCSKNAELVHEDDRWFYKCS